MLKKVFIFIFVLIIVAMATFFGLTLNNEIYRFIDNLETNDGYRFDMTYTEENGQTIYAKCSYNRNTDAYAFRFALQQNFQLITYRMMFINGCCYRIAEPGGILSAGLYSKAESPADAEENIIYQFVSQLKKWKWLTGFLFPKKTELDNISANLYDIEVGKENYKIWFQAGYPVKSEILTETLGSVVIAFANVRFESDDGLFQNPENGLYLKSDIVFDFFFNLFS